MLPTIIRCTTLSTSGFRRPRLAVFRQAPGAAPWQRRRLREMTHDLRAAGVHVAHSTCWQRVAPERVTAQMLDLSGLRAALRDPASLPW